MHTCIKDTGNYSPKPTLPEQNTDNECIPKEVRNRREEERFTDSFLTDIAVSITDDLKQLKNTMSAIVQHIGKREPSDYKLGSTDVCKLLHISKGTLKNYRDKGIIPYTKIGNKFLYSKNEIERKIEK